MLEVETPYYSLQFCSPHLTLVVDAESHPSPLRLLTSIPLLLDHTHLISSTSLPRYRIHIPQRSSSEPGALLDSSAARILPTTDWSPSTLRSPLLSSAIMTDSEVAATKSIDDNVTEEKTKGDNDDVDADTDEFSLALTKKRKKKPKSKKAADEPTTDTVDAESTDTVGVLPSSIQNPERDYNYTELLERVFSLLHEKNPALSTRKRYSMPPPQLVRVGTRKTMWTNFAQICALMHRQPEHVMSFLLAELGTDGSIDGNQRLVIKGRYQPKQAESLLKKYIVEYVTCNMCRNPETSLTRDSVTRLFFLQCESCGSRRSVAPIKSGFHATMRQERRKAMDQ